MQLWVRARLRKNCAAVRKARIPVPYFGAMYLATAQALQNCRGAAEARAVLAAGEPYLENEAVFHYLLRPYHLVAYGSEWLR